MSHHDEKLDLDVADFSERLVAFSLDLLLFAGLAYGTLALFFRRYPVWLNPHEYQWLALWMGLFLLYQAYFSSDGRVSLGKRGLGLRVADTSGEPLPLGQALIRSALYLASSVANAGFLWALFNPARQCWHDMAVGSVVLADRRHGRTRAVLVRVGATGFLALWAGLWSWHYLLAQRYHQLLDVGYAKVGAEEVKTLQHIHFVLKGRYAASLEELAPFSGAPKAFLKDMDALFDAKAVRIDVTQNGYVFQARAKDSGKTLIAFAGS